MGRTAPLRFPYVTYRAPPRCDTPAPRLVSGRFDYCGISLLIVGSFIPWLYYGFYCSFVPKVIYLTCVICLGSACMIVSLVDKFGEPEYRMLRAGQSERTERRG